MTATLWWLVQNSVAVAVLAAVVWVACRLLHTRPALQHALWLVVLIKFVTPPIVAWPWSARDIGDRIALFVAPIENESASSPADMSSSYHRSRFNDGSPVTAVPAVSNRTGELVEPITTTELMAASPGALVSETAIRFALWLFFGLWLAGSVIALAVEVRRIARHEAVVRRARPAPQPLVHEIAAVAGKLGLRPVPALVVPQIATPFVWCLGWLRLIWPEDLSSDTDLKRHRGIIAHELAHVKRRDHWVAWLELIAGCLWWWNPLFWYVRRQLRETADLACDAQALSLVPSVDRRAYAETFLELSYFASQRQTPGPALGVSTGAHRTVERRLSMILNERVKARTSLVGLLFAALLAVAALPAWSLGHDDSAAEPSSSAETTDQPAERDAPSRPYRSVVEELRQPGISRPFKGINPHEWPRRDDPQRHNPMSPEYGSPSATTLSLDAWRRDSVELIEGRILNFTSTDSPDKQKQIQEVADALSIGRDSSTSVVLNYRLAESQRAALLNFLMGLNASKGDVKVSLVEQDLRIVATPEVHLNLIRLISALRNGTREDGQSGQFRKQSEGVGFDGISVGEESFEIHRGPDGRSGQPAEKEPNDRGATDHILIPPEPSGLKRHILIPQEPSGLERHILTPGSGNVSKYAGSTSVFGNVAKYARH